MFSPLIIKNKMSPGLYQFSNLEHTDIVSKYTSDLFVNGVIRDIFLLGTKFIDYNHIALQEETYSFVVPKGTPIDFDTSSMKDWDNKLWDVYTVTKPKSEILKILKNTSKFGLTDEEYEKNKERLEGASDDDLYNHINQIIGNRQQGSVFVLPPPVPTPEEAEKRLLTKKIQDLEQMVKNKENEKNIEVQKFRDGYAILASAKKHVEQELERLKKELQDCEIDKEDFEKQMKMFEMELGQVRQAKDTCDLVNARKIKELEGKLKECEDRIKEKQIEIDAKEKGLTASVNRAETLSEQYKRLEELKNDLQKEIGLYRDQIAKQKTEITHEKEENKKTLEGIIEKLGN